MFWYYVSPFPDERWPDERWNVLFEGQLQPNVYDSQREAIIAAVAAAGDNFRKNDVSCGVRIKREDDWAVAVTFGAR